jgi:hypothetical protein
MALSDILFGTPSKMQAFPTLDPQQQQLMQQIYQGLQGSLGPGFENLQKILSGDTSAYEAPAMRQFEEEIIPGIAERFTGAGAGAQRSSAFTQGLGQAGAGLAENLAQQRAGLQSQALGQLGSFLGMGMQPTFQYQQMPGTEGMMGPFLKGLGSMGGQLGSFGLQGLLGKKLGLF